MEREEFAPMESFPKDGTRCKILFAGGNTSVGWFWGQEPVGQKYIIRGEHNKMSPYLTPIGWRKE